MAHGLRVLAIAEESVRQRLEVAGPSTPAAARHREANAAVCSLPPLLTFVLSQSRTSLHGTGLLTSRMGPQVKLSGNILTDVSRGLFSR